MTNNNLRLVLALAGALTALPTFVSAETVFEEVSVKYDGGGEDPVNSAAVDLYGNMYVTGGRGNSSGAGSNTYYTAKYDSYGREQWVRIHSPGQGSWIGQKDTMVVDRSGNAYVALSQSYVFGKVLKYDRNGNETVLVEGDSIPESYDSRIGLELDGSENSLFLGASNSIRKISLDGGTGWTRQLLNWNTWVRDIAVDGSGNLYAIGTSAYTSGNGTTDIIVKKFDSNGNVIWSQLWYGEGKQNETAYGLELDSSGNVYVLVQALNFEQSCLYCNTPIVVKFDADGAILGSVALSGTGYLAGSIKVANDDVYVTIQNQSTQVMTVQKLNADLALGWSTVYSGGTSTPMSMDVDGLGNVIVGIRKSYGTATVKFDMNGNLLWTKSGAGYDLAFVKFGTTGEIYAAGSNGDALMYRYGVTQLICQ